ncbi:hypothetical protein CHARACLAT_030827 [Characodon lateralis]|uniref:Phosphoserine phosphatase n=2 Tax=Goodeidae TaxID=28758 RepID=A0ABU7ENT3_9TELE|nr:hypothetical protein [Characodon lateralis]
MSKRAACLCLINAPLFRTMTTIQETKELFRRADAVCFDVDSTVIKEEGIDELAIFCGVGDAVREMTLKAMGGSMTFKKALTERLSIIRCSREQVNKLITDHPPQLTPGIKELVDRLHERNIKVFLISGGFRCIVEHVASQLNIPLHHVYANRLKFYFNGEYAGFDESQPTAESGGKGKVISMLKEQNGFKTVVMIGDGATDLEACPPAVSELMQQNICINVLEMHSSEKMTPQSKSFEPKKCFYSLIKNSMSKIIYILYKNQWKDPYWCYSNQGLIIADQFFAS